MVWFVRRNLFAGVSGACVVGLGIATVWPIFSNYGDNWLKFRVRSHPDVAAKHHPDLVGKFG